MRPAAVLARVAGVGLGAPLTLAAQATAASSQYGHVQPGVAGVPADQRLAGAVLMFLPLPAQTKGLQAHLGNRPGTMR
ncbi:hypothetical protein ACQEVF_07060 [Nonomuraea polychroma]|uniref:hypothetical protein n=1 Tax=Nonomuraea polychroma TaxID=46176 RepID=UPI003D8A2901